MEKNLTTEDSLKVIQNEDGGFTLEWDKNDPKWNFLNGLTSKEIGTMISNVIAEMLEKNDEK